MLVILVKSVVDPKRIIGKNGGPRRRRGVALLTKKVSRRLLGQFLQHEFTPRGELGPQG
jgi:hypothetical protein